MTPPPPKRTADPSIRLQNIALETQELMAYRQMAWTEATNRASMFMTIVGAAVFGLALIGNATDFTGPFVLTALLVLPVLLFVGLSSLARLNELNAQDWRLIQGLNRMRRLRVELDPDIEPYLVNSVHDDLASILDSYGPVNARLHSFWTLDALIGILVAVLAAFVGGLLAVGFTGNVGLAAAVGLATFVIVMGLLVLVAYRSFSSAFSTWSADNPAPGRASADSPPAQTV